MVPTLAEFIYSTWTTCHRRIKIPNHCGTFDPFGLNRVLLISGVAKFSTFHEENTRHAFDSVMQLLKIPLMMTCHVVKIIYNN